jgi:hypothetical protein
MRWKIFFYLREFPDIGLLFYRQMLWLMMLMPVKILEKSCQTQRRRQSKAFTNYRFV